MKIGIIGGKGVIGSFLANFFRKKGEQVFVSDLDTKLSNRELIEQVDVVAFSVPLHLTESIIKDSIRFTRKEQLLLDFSSLKVSSIKAMMKSKANVIGLHPMFRPSKNGVKNQTEPLQKYSFNPWSQ